MVNVAIPLFEGFTALDAVGPYEVLSRLPGASVTFLAATTGPVCTENGSLAMLAARSLADLPGPDVVVVPGGPGTRALLADETLLGWLRAAHRTSRWTTSVCTGSLLLGAAGLLAGLRATTHWLVLERLAEFGAIPTSERVIEQGRVITAAGVSAGIDMALTLAARIAGEHAAQVIQLSIEYDPRPPFDAGAPDTAPRAVLEAVRARASARG